MHPIAYAAHVMHRDSGDLDRDFAMLRQHLVGCPPDLPSMRDAASLVERIARALGGREAAKWLLGNSGLALSDPAAFLGAIDERIGLKVGCRVTKHPACFTDHFENAVASSYLATLEVAREQAISEGSEKPAAPALAQLSGRPDLN